MVCAAALAGLLDERTERFEYAARDHSMKNSISYMMIGVLALGFFFVDTAAFGQSGGRVGAAGGARGGAVVGPYGGSAARASRGGTVYERRRSRALVQGLTRIRARPAR